MKTLLICTVIGLSNWALAYTLDAKNGSTRFLAVGRPAAIKISGKGSGPAGTLSLKKVGTDYVLNAETKMDLDSLDTGIGMRDHHMKEKYLQTTQYKEAVLKMTDVPVSAALVQAGGDLKAPGILKLHGVEKPVEVTVHIKPDSTGALLTSSTFHLKLSDYGIEIPKFSGITVADEVEISTETPVAKTVLTETL